MSDAKQGAVQAFIFDLDGTLIDSKMDLVHSVNAMLRQTGRAELPADLIASYVGYGAPQLIASVLGPSSNEEQRHEALAVFFYCYGQKKLEQTRAYPGVVEGLRALDGVPMAVLSNKPTDFSVEILKALNLAQFFRATYGGDSFDKKKPDPNGALTILEALGVAPQQAAMVGDSDVDVLTARNAGMLAIGVTFGFGQHDCQAHPFDLYVNRLTELVTLAAPQQINP